MMMCLNDANEHYDGYQDSVGINREEVMITCDYPSFKVPQSDTKVSPQKPNQCHISQL